MAKGQVTPSFLSATDKKAIDYATQVASQSQLPDARRNIIDVLETTEFQGKSVWQSCSRYGRCNFFNSISIHLIVYFMYVVLYIGMFFMICYKYVFEQLAENLE